MYIYSFVIPPPCRIPFMVRRTKTEAQETRNRLLDAAERGYLPAMMPIAGAYAEAKAVPKSAFEAYDRFVDLIEQQMETFWQRQVGG